MYREQILGQWKSAAYLDANGIPRKYDRQELTFRVDGTGNMHARTLLKRNTPFEWEFDGSDFYIYNLGGPGAVAVAAVEENGLSVIELGLLIVYVRC